MGPRGSTGPATETDTAARAVNAHRNAGLFDFTAMDSPLSAYQRQKLLGCLRLAGFDLGFDAGNVGHGLGLQRRGQCS